MTRITDRDLEGMVKRLNTLTKMPLTSYSIGADGHYVSNAGNYHLDRAYGGVKLVRMSLTPGCSGVSEPIYMGYTTKRDCYARIYAFIRGIETQQEEGA